MRPRLFETADPVQRVTEVVVGFGKIWVQGERFVVLLDRCFGTIESGEDHTEVMVCFSGISSDLQGAAEPILRVFQSTLVKANHPEVVKRAEMALVGLEHGFVEPLCLRQTLLPVHCDCLLKYRLSTEGCSRRTRRHPVDHSSVLLDFIWSPPLARCCIL